MRRYLVISAAILISSLLAATVAQAAPVRQEVLYEITSPRPNAEVRGSVEIVGSARHPQFDFYKLDYASSARPDEWIDIGQTHDDQRTNATLEVWHTTALPDGAYFIRLWVVTKDGNYQRSEPVRVIVANAQPAPTPTPAESPTPTATVFIPTPTTAVVEQPTVVVESTATPISTTGSGEGDTPSPTTEGANTISIPSAGVFAKQCVFGGVVAAILFVFAGAVVLVRKLI